MEHNNVDWLVLVVPYNDDKLSDHFIFLSLVLEMALVVVVIILIEAHLIIIFTGKAGFR